MWIDRWTGGMSTMALEAFIDVTERKRFQQENETVIRSV